MQVLLTISQLQQNSVSKTQSKIKKTKLNKKISRIFPFRIQSLKWAHFIPLFRAHPFQHTCIVRYMYQINGDIHTAVAACTDTAVAGLPDTPGHTQGTA